MIRDFNGNEIPVGKTIRTLEENFLGDTLPSWLTVTVGTSSIVPPSTDYGYLEMKTAATSGTQARLNIIPAGILLSKVKEVSIKIDSLILSSDKTQFFLALSSTDTKKGVLFADFGFEVKARAYNATGNIEKLARYWIIGNGEYKRSRNIEIRVRNDGTVIALESGIVFFEHKFSPSEMDTNGLINPRILVQNNGASTEQYLRMSKLSVSIVHN